MVSPPLCFGLSSDIINTLEGVFSQYPEIERVLIFGSRANGNFKDGSDIDLAILAPTLSDSRFAQLWNQLDELPIVFKMDILHWDRLANQHLRTKVLDEGRVLFPSQ